MSNKAERLKRKSARCPRYMPRLVLRCRAYALTDSEAIIAKQLAERHDRVKIYRSQGGIVLSREALYSPGVVETFWLREPIPQNVEVTRGADRKGDLKQ